ncbi:MAG: hypothetical protein NWF05_00170 [Candidatus Bathyarchaeota archaeon]|nr:hypothetical protein [Candidatus Bathyarchaeota archaeon]
MEKLGKGRFVRVATLALLALGVALVVASAFYGSSFLAIIGLAIGFWAAILFYIKPVKHVPLSLFTASADSIFSNIERVLIELKLTSKGVYLPPKNLKDIESSLVFVPKHPKTSLPTSGETNEKLYCDQKNGVFFSPPGLELCRMFERELGVSFTKVDLAYLQEALPKLMVTNLEAAEALEINVIGNIVVVEATGTLFCQLCQKTDAQMLTHNQLGCLFSSAIACALAKAAGEPVIILREARNLSVNGMRIEYLIESPVVVLDEAAMPIIFGKDAERFKPPEGFVPTPPEIPIEVTCNVTTKEADREESPPPNVPVIVINPQAEEKDAGVIESKAEVSIVQEPPIPVITINEEHLGKHAEAPYVEPPNFWPIQKYVKFPLMTFGQPSPLFVGAKPELQEAPEESPEHVPLEPAAPIVLPEPPELKITLQEAPEAGSAFSEFTPSPEVSPPDEAPDLIEENVWVRPKQPNASPPVTAPSEVMENDFEGPWVTQKEPETLPEEPAAPPQEPESSEDSTTQTEAPQELKPDPLVEEPLAEEPKAAETPDTADNNDEFAWVLEVLEAEKKAPKPEPAFEVPPATESPPPAPAEEPAFFAEPTASEKLQNGAEDLDGIEFPMDAQKGDAAADAFQDSQPKPKVTEKAFSLPQKE